MSSERQRIVATEIAVVTMALIWGVNYSVIKYGMSLVTPLAYNGSRVALAAIALTIVALIWGGPRPSRRDILALMGLGILGNGVYQVLFAEGIARTRAGEAALVVGGSPALIALLGRMLGVERITRRGAMGIILSIFGVGLVVLGRATSGAGSAQGGSVFGDMLVLIGSVCWAVYTVMLMPFTQRVNGFWVISCSLIGGSLVLLVAGMPAIVKQDWAALPLSGWGAMLYSGWGALVVAYLLWYKGVKVLGPTRTALFGNLQPLIALLVAWITLHEQPTVWQTVGAATIVGGVLLTRVPASEAS